jgi:hypothetical protein
VASKNEKSELRNGLGNEGDMKSGIFLFEHTYDTMILKPENPRGSLSATLRRKGDASLVLLHHP